MALKLYDTLNPSGDFPLVEAKDVKMPDGSRLSEFNPSVGEEVLDEIEALKKQDQTMAGDITSLKAQDQYIATVAGQVVGRVTALETPALSVDMTEFGTGKIKETKADGAVVTYTFFFDEDGNPIRINDTNGNSTELIGFGQMSYKSAEGASF